MKKISPELMKSGIFDYVLHLTDVDSVAKSTPHYLCRTNHGTGTNRLESSGQMTLPCFIFPRLLLKFPVVS